MVHDVIVIGGGIVGVASAKAIAETSRASVLLLEKEPRLAAHQTGNNSGVIHSGLYYRAGSLKARNCVAGRQALYRFCEEHDIAHERCGKLVVATRPEQLPALEELERRGRANGLTGLQRLAAGELAEHEPHCTGTAGLFVPETGIVDYIAVTEAMAAHVRELGGTIATSAGVRAVRSLPGELVVETASGSHHARHLVNCGGLQCDRVARLCGVEPGIRIVPFRGEYWKLAPDRCHLVRGLIYPVPDPTFPFLGVHFTRRITGGVEAGPNAVLALEREGYTRFSFSPRDTLETLTYPGFVRLAVRYWRTGFGEVWRSFSRRAFARALAELVPEVTAADLVPGGAGVRAQALDRHGNLLDDFHIVEAERSLHVLNAPSPAATASLAIGATIAERAASLFGLHAR